MNIDQFENISCYEEFEIRSTLIGISKISILKKIGYKIKKHYFFVSNDGIFNWFDLKGNHIDDPDILKSIKEDYISRDIIKCVIPDSVTHIYKGAFCYCVSLKEITIPNSVTRIGEKAFICCTSLTEITIPNSITSIGDYAFSHCKSLSSITILNDATRIGSWTFHGCKSLKEVIFKYKTLEEVKRMVNYPFGIKDESIIKCELQ
jgi:hypothetical protein